jgi:hypothetical protein
MYRKADFRFDVFVSYSHQDKDRVRTLVDRLRGEGLRVWFDERDIEPGSSFPAEISKGLQESKKAVFCLSSTALESHWVQTELNTAIARDPQNKQRRFILLRLDNCQFPDLLNQFQWLNWQSGNNELIGEVVRFCRPPNRQKRRKGRIIKTIGLLPDRKMEIGNPLYVERAADDIIHSIASSPYTTSLTIKAPEGLGKSSLLKRYAQACQDNGKQIVELGFLRLAGTDLLSYPSFLTQLARLLWRELGKSLLPEPSSQLDHLTFDDYIESLLSVNSSERVVFAFDNVDRVIGTDYQDSFISKLNDWEDRRDSQTAWAKLEVAIVISTECFLTISSPDKLSCNVGRELKLYPFDETESKKLRRLYRELYDIRLSDTEFGRLMGLLKGHPKLFKIAYDYLIGHHNNTENLLAKAAEVNGPFKDHLRGLEEKLRKDPLLVAALKQIVRDGTLLGNNADLFFRLESAGLVSMDGNRYVPANELYARFSYRL